MSLLAQIPTDMAYLQIANSRGGRALIIDDYRYLRNKVKLEKNKIYWRCGHRGCPSWVHTRLVDFDEQDPDIEVIRAPGDHNHVAEEDLVATTALIQQMLQQVVADPTLPVKRVYDQAVARAPAARLRLMPPFNAVKSRLERKRAAMMPPVPQTIDEVVVDGEWAATWDGEDFLSKHHHQHGFLVFATEENYTRLAQCEQVIPLPLSVQSVTTCFARLIINSKYY